MRFKQMARLVAVAGIASLALTACGDDGGGDAGGEACDVALGFFGAQTGDAANLGINISNGVEVAVEEFNKGDGCDVELVKYDSEGVPEKATSLAQEVINNEKLIGIIGPAFSGESDAANPIFDEAGIPLISASATNPQLSKNGWKVFHRVLGHDASQGPALAKYIKDVMKAEKVFVVDDASTYGKSLADIVKNDLGTAVVGTDTVQQKQTDFATTVTKIKSSGATTVFFGGYYAEAGLLRKQLSDAGSQAITLVGGDGIKDAGYVEAAGAAAAEGTIITCPCVPPEEAEGTFAEDYQAKFDTAPGTYSAEGYDAAKIFLDGIADGKTTREAMLEFINSYDKPGITKQLKFDETGEVADQTTWAYKVAGGEIVADQVIK